LGSRQEKLRIVDDHNILETHKINWFDAFVLAQRLLIKELVYRAEDSLARKEKKSALIQLEEQSH